MKKSITLCGIVLLASLAACAPSTPVVSAYNGDSVTIVTHSLGDRQQSLAASTAEAQRICQKGSKKKAEHVSTRYNPNTYENADLFLCLN